jgi:23S rRNA pseudouridine2605 synthase
MQMSRKSAELLIKAGQVTVLGSEITNPNHLISVENAFGSVKVAGKLLQLDIKKEHLNTQSASKDLIEDETSTTRNEILKPHKTRVWIANKLPGELVSEHDPQGRPSLLERLSRGGVGRSRSNKSQKIHLKPIGRLDMMTEGLILVTNDGTYAHEMEHPKNKLHRTYRVRVHGFITPQKLHSLRKGMNIDGMFYKGMKVNLEIVRDNKGRSKLNKQQRTKGGNTNTWLRITCIEGKNRQIRKTLEHVGLKVTRLIRVSFGDYELNTIPRGMAIEVPFKTLESQKKKGDLLTAIRRDQRKNTDISRSQKGTNDIEAVQWIRH